MIVGCYTLTLYCKNYDTYNQGVEEQECKRRFTGHNWPLFPDEYIGNTEGECRKQARKRGWKFVKGDAICPQCNQARNNK